MKIALVNTIESPCPFTHNKACNEFIQGFTDYGYTASEINNLESCIGIDVLLLSSHNINIEYLQKMNNLNPNAIYILWFYFDVIDKIPFKKYILTGEHYYYTPFYPDNIRWYNIGLSNNKYVPFLLRVNERVDKIGTYKKTYSLNGAYAGTPYKKDWIDGLDNVIYHDIYTNGMLTSDERRDMYLKAKIAFGFHHDDNIKNNHVTQRTFEGLAYGCVVISDNICAHDMTGGIIEYVSSKSEFIEKYNYFLSNPEECYKKEKQGYEWVKKYGTNRYAAKLFIDKFIELGY